MIVDCIEPHISRQILLSDNMIFDTDWIAVLYMCDRYHTKRLYTKSIYLQHSLMLLVTSECRSIHDPGANI